MPTYDQLRQQHIAQANALLPQYQERLSWSADRLQQERERGLQALVRTAQDRSPWHRQRLAGIDPAALTEDDLEAIPPMTKADLMDNWDGIVTDQQLNLGLVNDHLDKLTTDQYLLDGYHAVASGGSTGRRGVFVYDWAGWMAFFLLVRRRAPVTQGPIVQAVVAAGKSAHLTSALPQTFANADWPVHRFPVDWPIERIVDGLNQVQPTHLGGYPSALYLLANEARAGRLQIAPGEVGTYAEPLLPEIRAGLEEAWGEPVANMWGCSEGGLSRSCGQGRGMHLDDDCFILEVVDAQGRPVPAGVRGAKIYLTNLFNHAMPLIRYEITDEITLLDEPCPCGSAHRRIADVMGRLDDTFVYGGDLQVHPHLFRSALGSQANILEYQVRQTQRGAAIAVRSDGVVDMVRLKRDIERGLVGLGLQAPELSLDQVEGFTRQDTGKLKRFIPLAA
ncbi:MAG: hypothetical protein GKR89_34150 [Candidatus Latescibacteria bacterium]|nr:hypothetical protein [Candidatus Latescibacterota bacterium]